MSLTSFASVLLLVSALSFLLFGKSNIIRRHIRTPVLVTPLTLGLVVMIFHMASALIVLCFLTTWSTVWLSRFIDAVDTGRSQEQACQRLIEQRETWDIERKSLLAQLAASQLEAGQWKCHVIKVEAEMRATTVCDDLCSSADHFLLSNLWSENRALMASRQQLSRQLSTVTEESALKIHLLQIQREDEVKDLTQKEADALDDVEKLEKDAAELADETAKEKKELESKVAKLEKEKKEVQTKLASAQKEKLDGEALGKKKSELMEKKYMDRISKLQETIQAIQVKALMDVFMKGHEI